jgi:peptidoglycan/LPS O-acetylase OafA/YrhL
LWSLLLEAMAYVGFAAFACRVSDRGLVAWAGVSGAALAGFCAYSSGQLHEFGGFWSTFPEGLARVSFSFTAGMLIYRRRKKDELRRGADRRAWLLLAVLLAVMLVMPGSAGSGGLLAILAIFPALVWFASKWDLPSGRAGSLLGELSYPLYCIHMPILALAAASGIARPLTWAALIGASLLLDRWWDRPARRWLAMLWKRSAPQTRIGIST